MIIENVMRSDRVAPESCFPWRFLASNTGINRKGAIGIMTDLITAAKSGDKRATLIALRDKLAETIQNCDSGRDMASNSKRLMEVMAEIEALPDENPVVSKHDRLKSKHENR